MRLCLSSAHLLGLVAIFTNPWTTVNGQENHHRNTRGGDQNVRGDKKYKRDDGVARDTRGNFRDIFSAQNNSVSVAHTSQRKIEEEQDDGKQEWSILYPILRLEALREDNRLCAWGLASLGGTLRYASLSNIAFPSLDSNYWVTGIRIKDLDKSIIKITGKAPNARYFSFQTYMLEDRVSSIVGALTDVDVKLAADGTYTVLINDGQDTGDPTVSSLKGLPFGHNEGIIVLMYRTYDPTPFSSPAGGVPLPLITIKRMGGTLRNLRYCSDPEPVIDVNEPSNHDTIFELKDLPTDRAVDVWFRPEGERTPFPNNDVAYLATDNGIYPVRGYAVVLRGKAPTFPNGVEENPQVRYWSICKLSLPSTKTVACLQDSDIALDSEGRYVIVVAPEEPSGSGFTYLNFGPGPKGSVAFRHMLPSEEFYPMSVQNVDFGDDDATIRSKMGEYYPMILYCKIETIEKKGVDECF